MRTKRKIDPKTNDNTRKQKLFKINLVNDKLTRKQKRKESRKLKKIKKNAFSRNESIPTLDEYLEVKKMKFQTEIDKKRKKKEKIQNKIDKMKDKKIQKKIERDAERARLEVVKEEEREERILRKAEEKSLKDLEKKLNLNKKRKTLPQGFINDGLDYLLEVVEGKTDVDYEKEKPDWLNESDEDDMNKDMGNVEEYSGVDDDMVEEPSFDSEEDDDMMEELSCDSEEINMGYNDKIIFKNNKININKIENLKNIKSPKSILKKTESYKSDDKKSLTWNEELEKPNKKQADAIKKKVKVANREVDADILEKKTKKTEETECDEELTEDIYGRVRNTKGEILDTNVQRSRGGTYVPPAKRAMVMEDSEGRKQILEKLKKQLKGLINRLSESNILSITNQIEEFYLCNSRADVSQTLTELIMAACITTTLTPERLSQELVLLVTVLHSNIGMEVGAYFLQTVVSELDNQLSKINYGVGKTVENILMLITTLYNFQVVHCSLMFDILRKFIQTFTERDIELLIFIIKNIGFTLRKDDPANLKEIIMLMQAKASDVEASGRVEKTRVKFMLDVILAIKNNNMRKIPNYDPARTEHLKKLLRSFIKGGNLSSNQLSIGLTDLLLAENKGKWWLVGSAWSGRNTSQDVTATSEGISKTLSEANTALLELAQKQRMNTDTRKSIFLVLMTSEDFVDAFEKLLGLGLKHQQEREIIHVILSCCLQEKDFNLYYAYLIQKFCQFDRRFQMTLQYYLWDKFKEMSNLSSRSTKNLVNIVNHQLVHQAMTLSILKVVEFGTLEKPMVNFLKQLLEELLLANTQEVIENIFHKVAMNEKLRHLQEGLRLFLVHFLLRKKGAVKDDSQSLAQKIEIAEKTLSEGQRTMLL